MCGRSAARGSTRFRPPAADRRSRHHRERQPGSRGPTRRRRFPPRPRLGVTSPDSSRAIAPGRTCAYSPPAPNRRTLSRHHQPTEPNTLQQSRRLLPQRREPLNRPSKGCPPLPGSRCRSRRVSVRAQIPVAGGRTHTGVPRAGKYGALQSLCWLPRDQPYSCDGTYRPAPTKHPGGPRRRVSPANRRIADLAARAGRKARRRLPAKQESRRRVVQER